MNNPTLITEFLNLFQGVVINNNIPKTHTYSMNETGVQLGQATWCKGYCSCSMQISVKMETEKVLLWLRVLEHLVLFFLH